MNGNESGQNPQLRDYLTVLEKGLAGDLVFVCLPATVNRSATASAWTRKVVIELRTANGEVHEWFNKAITTGCSIADTSTAGTATIPSTTLTFVNGKAEVTISGSAASWLATETNTLTITALTLMGYTVASKTSVETIV